MSSTRHITGPRVGFSLDKCAVCSFLVLGADPPRQRAEPAGGALLGVSGAVCPRMAARNCPLSSLDPAGRRTMPVSTETLRKLPGSGERLEDGVALTAIMQQDPSSGECLVAAPDASEEPGS